MRSALLCLDLINDIVHPEGKVSQKRGYADFAAEHDTLQRIARIQEQFRQQNLPVIHARLQFSVGHPEIRRESKIFGDWKGSNILVRKTWGTEFIPETAPKNDEPVITKHRISAFYRTRLELILNSMEVENVFICGCATNLAINSTAREAMDRDFNTFVLADACIDMDEPTHTSALLNMGRCVSVTDFADVALKLTA